MEPNSPSIIQRIDAILGELTTVLKNAVDWLMAFLGLPEHLFGGEAALFLVLGIPLALGIAFGGIFWRRGNRWFESAMEMIERFVEGRLEAHLAKQGARQNVQAMAEPAAPDRNPPDPR